MLAAPAIADATAVRTAPMPISKSELESKHLAELHRLAADAGVPRFRLLRRDEPVEEVLVRGAAGSAQGSEEKSEAEGEEQEREPRPRRRRRRRSRGDSEKPPGNDAGQATA